MMRVSAPATRSRTVIRFCVPVLGVCLAAWSAPLIAQRASTPQPLDRFDAPKAWQSIASDGVRAAVGPAPGPNGSALRLDFDLGGTAGYAAARRALPIDLPANYEITLLARADAPVNDFQFKLVDASGDNVWWFRRPDFEFSREWRLVKIRKRQLEFAWGPTADRTLRHVATIELVINAGRDGGAGSIYFSELTLRELPPEDGAPPPPSAQASSFLPGAEPVRAVDGNLATAWSSDPAAGKTQSVTLDLGRAR